MTLSTLVSLALSSGCGATGTASAPTPLAARPHLVVEPSGPVGGPLASDIDSFIEAKEAEGKAKLVAALLDAVRPILESSTPIFAPQARAREVLLFPIVDFEGQVKRSSERLDQLFADTLLEQGITPIGMEEVAARIRGLPGSVDAVGKGTSISDLLRHIGADYALTGTQSSRDQVFEFRLTFHTARDTRPAVLKKVQVNPAKAPAEERKYWRGLGDDIRGASASSAYPLSPGGELASAQRVEILRNLTTYLVQTAAQELPEAGASSGWFDIRAMNLPAEVATHLERELLRSTRGAATPKSIEAQARKKIWPRPSIARFQRHADEFAALRDELGFGALFGAELQVEAGILILQLYSAEGVPVEPMGTAAWVSAATTPVRGASAEAQLNEALTSLVQVELSVDQYRELFGEEAAANGGASKSRQVVLHPLQSSRTSGFFNFCTYVRSQLADERNRLDQLVSEGKLPERSGLQDALTSEPVSVDLSVAGKGPGKHKYSSWMQAFSAFERQYMNFFKQHRELEQARTIHATGLQKLLMDAGVALRMDDAVFNSLESNNQDPRNLSRAEDPADRVELFKSFMGQYQLMPAIVVTGPSDASIELRLVQYDSAKGGMPKVIWNTSCSLTGPRVAEIAKAFGSFEEAENSRGQALAIQFASAMAR